MRIRAVVTIGLIALAVAATGCSKRAWVAQHGPGGYGEAPAPAPAARPPVEPVAQAAPREAPSDPAREGGAALPAPGALVAEQLPWQDIALPASPAPPPAGGGGCGDAPCHWVQVAAPVDSFGCAALLRRAGAVLTAEAIRAGGAVRYEGGLWKVQLGPFARWEDAEAARDRLRASGFAEAWLVRR